MQPSTVRHGKHVRLPPLTAKRKRKGPVSQTEAELSSWLQKHLLSEPASKTAKGFGKPAGTKDEREDGTGPQKGRQSPVGSLSTSVAAYKYSYFNSIPMGEARQTLLFNAEVSSKLALVLMRPEVCDASITLHCVAALCKTPLDTELPEAISVLLSRCERYWDTAFSEQDQSAVMQLIEQLHQQRLQQLSAESLRSFLEHAAQHTARLPSRLWELDWLLRNLARVQGKTARDAVEMHLWTSLAHQLAVAQPEQTNRVLLQCSDLIPLPAALLEATRSLAAGSATTSMQVCAGMPRSSCCIVHVSTASPVQVRLEGLHLSHNSYRAKLHPDAALTFAAHSLASPDFLQHTQKLQHLLVELENRWKDIAAGFNMCFAIAAPGLEDSNRLLWLWRLGLVWEPTCPLASPLAPCLAAQLLHVQVRACDC